MRIACLGLMSLALSWTTAAQAGPSDPQAKALADALFADAQQDFSDGKHAQACNKFEQVIRLDDTLGGRLQLAICYEKINKLASASALYAEVERIGAPSNVKKDQDAAAMAQKLHAELKPRIPLLEIVVSAPIRTIRGLEVKQNGTNIPESLWNQPVPVDMGMQAIEVTAPGRAPWRTSIDINHEFQLGSKPFRIEVQAPPVSAGMAETNASPARTVGYVGIAVGAAGLGVGAVLGGLSISKNGDSKEGNHCKTNNVCDSVGKPIRQEALALANGSTIAFIVGGALLGTGIILVATSSKTKTTNTGLLLSPTGIGWREHF